MPAIDERLCDPVSTAELERRWTAARTYMRSAKVDALIVQGANGYAGTAGYYRWLTGMPSVNSYPHTAILPRHGLMTLVQQGDRGGERTMDGAVPEFRGVGRRLSTPSFPAIAYCSAYDAEIIAAEISRSGYRSVGLVGAFAMYHGFATRLRELLGGVTLVDATDALDDMKAVKSVEDIAFIRRTAAMQDDVMSKVHSHLRPGMRDFEVAAYGQYLGQLGGSEAGYFLANSAPPGKPTMLRHRPYQGRVIREGDVLMFQAENTGPGGFFVHLGRVFVLGKAPQELVDAFGAMVEAQEYTLKLLKPGAASRDIFESYNAYMRSRGFPEERRLHCHGQGYEVVERPLIRNDETMKVSGNMNIGIHPSISNARMFMTVCDNFLIGQDGSAERLHRTPQKIVE
ncbi:MAG: M24 family metallopeptidase, partial [Sulfuricaulis sp.]|nr:M24 family metallopeptidase [Sulfuricaulis sp.]